MRVVFVCVILVRSSVLWSLRSQPHKKNKESIKGADIVKGMKLLLKLSHLVYEQICL